MSDNTALLTQDAESSGFMNRYFIFTDNDAYVAGMMIAINQEEADGYIAKKLTEIPEDVFESIGQDSKYVDGQVIQGEPRIPELTEESASAIKNGLFREATDRIQALLDAIDLGMSESGDDVRLTEWKKYRVLLMRIDTAQPLEIKWPELPEN